MYYDYYETKCYEVDECVTTGMCSINPTLSSLQEIILIYLKELAYYLLKLKEFGAENEVIKENILEAISGTITNIDYNFEQFQKLIMILSQDLSQAKSLYGFMSKKNNKEPLYLKSYFRLNKTFNISEIIKKGEKHYKERNIEFSSEQKDLFDIVIMLVKRICFKIIQIKSYNKDDKKAFNTILILLNTLNADDISIDETKKIIETSNLEYYKLFKELSEVQEEFYGHRESVNIPFTPRNGKAILVSGIDLRQLEAVLEVTKNRNVDVYTHGMTMLMAHTLPKFREYPHLVGHFGKGSEYSLFDFAAFPGAILMTRYLFQKVDYLYRGRLFTEDIYASPGIAKIQNNDFEPLIQSALKAKGFTKQEQEVILRVGFKQKILEEKCREIIDKMKKDEIRHLYFIGILHHKSEHKAYFEKFLELMPKDCYAISLSHEKNEENILHVDSFYDYLLIFKILEEFSQHKPLAELKITIFITKCDQYTITNIINLINLGIKDIYICQCSPILINPALMKTIKKNFNIKEFSDPDKDLESTLSGINVRKKHV